VVALMATRAAVPESVVLDQLGAGQALFSPRGDFVVEHTRVSVGPAPGAAKVVRQPVALLLLNGTEFESTRSGSSDQSDARHLMQAGDTLEVRWTGGDAGATATVYVRGIAYPAGQGIGAMK
jgi:hypothetical protein